MKKQQTSSFSSLIISSVLAVVIFLVIVSLSSSISLRDIFKVKYPGLVTSSIDLQSQFAQVGLLGRKLSFTPGENGRFDIEISNLTLDESILGENEKYAAALVPANDGSSPFWYRTSSRGDRETRGYPLAKNIYEDVIENLGSAADAGLGSVPSASLESAIPGLVQCKKTDTDPGYFEIFFEDIAYETGVGFDDPTYGEARVLELCTVTHEFEAMFGINGGGNGNTLEPLTPQFVVQSSELPVPDAALSVVAPQYLGGGGFVNTFLADYLQTGVRSREHSIQENFSILGIDSGYMRFDFSQQGLWDVDVMTDMANAGEELERAGPGGEPPVLDAYDFKTVARHNILRLLGFQSFIGHEQENILSDSWRRWTSLDVLVKDTVSGDKVVESEVDDPDFLKYNLRNMSDVFPGDSARVDSELKSDNLVVTGTAIPESIDNQNPAPGIFIGSMPSIFNSYPLFSSDLYQKGQSLSGLDDGRSADGTMFASYPILEKDVDKPVSQAEKEVLCWMGLRVQGVPGCEVARSVPIDDHIFVEDNLGVCINMLENDKNAFTDRFTVDFLDHISNTDFNDITRYADVDCKAQATQPPLAQTKSIFFEYIYTGEPGEEVSVYEEFDVIEYRIKDTESGRRSYPAYIYIDKCIIDEATNLLCNHNFEFNQVRSPIDLQLPSLEAVDSDDDGALDRLACSYGFVPGWCGQGTPDVYNSLYGYTWHPYLLQNPPPSSDEEALAFGPEGATDNRSVGTDSPTRSYAGGSSEILIQRLRQPLLPNTSYDLEGHIFVSNNSTGNPNDVVGTYLWVASEDQLLRQPDGSYHIFYPWQLRAGEEMPQQIPIDLSEATAGEWYWFGDDDDGDASQRVTFNTGDNDAIQYIGIGSISQGASVYFDNLYLYQSEICDCNADFDGNCTVNSGDLGALLSLFGNQCGLDGSGCLTGLGTNVDLDQNGTVNSGDMGAVLGQFGQCATVGGVGVGPDNSDLGRGLAISSDQDSSIDEDDIEYSVEFTEPRPVQIGLQSFESNLKVTLYNLAGKDVDGVRISKILNPAFLYEGHLATKPGTSYNSSLNYFSIPEINRAEKVELYFDVRLLDSVCYEFGIATESSYVGMLGDLGLCDAQLEQKIERRKTELLDRFNVSRSYECSDGKDNDGDGYIDKDDLGCVATGGKVEKSVGENYGGSSYTGQCADGIDNDGDGYIDASDFGCTGGDNNKEDNVGVGIPECKDTIDNDGDGRVDNRDAQCSDPDDASESE